MAREYADRNGLDLDDKLTFRDLGVSAFRGKNAEAGSLDPSRPLVSVCSVPKTLLGSPVGARYSKVGRTSGITMCPVHTVSDRVLLI